MLSIEFHATYLQYHSEHELEPEFRLEKKHFLLTKISQFQIEDAWQAARYRQIDRPTKMIVSDNLQWT